MTTDPIAMARAFNEGSDARLMGISQHACYYKHDKTLKTYWNLGWSDVNDNYGREAQWPIQPLKEIPKQRKNNK